MGAGLDTNVGHMVGLAVYRGMTNTKTAAWIKRKPNRGAKPEGVICR